MNNRTIKIEITLTKEEVVQAIRNYINIESLAPPHAKVSINFDSRATISWEGKKGFNSPYDNWKLEAPTTNIYDYDI